MPAQRCSELLRVCFTAAEGILEQQPLSPVAIPIGFYLLEHQSIPFRRRRDVAGGETISPDICACVSEDHLTGSSLLLTKSYLIASALKKKKTP